MANVFACRSSDSILARSARLWQPADPPAENRRNVWLWWAVASTFILQLAVIYTPFLQDGSQTTSLSIMQLLYCVAASSVVYLLIELQKWYRYRE